MSIKIILAAVFVIGAIAGLGIAMYSVAKRNKNSSSSMAAWIVGAVFVLCFALIPWNIREVEVGTVAVVKVWGKASDTRTAGLYWDNMFSISYEIYDSRVQSLDINTGAYSSDGQTMDIGMTVQYQIQIDKAVEIANNFDGLSSLSQRISAVVTEQVKSVLSQKAAMDIIRTRNEVSPKVEETIRATIGQGNYYVDITTVVLTDIAFTDAFEKTVEDKMIAEQDKLKAQYEKEKAIIKAEEEAEIARIKAEAALEVARKTAEEKILIARAEAEAVEINAAAEAEALELLQAVWADLDDATRAALLKAKFYEKWNGVLPEVLGGDYSLIFPLD